MNTRGNICFCIVVTVLIALTTAHADTPLIAGQVTVDGDVTRYAYTLTNTISPGSYVGGFYDMTVPDGSILPTGHAEPSGWTYWYATAVNVPWGEFYWSTSDQQYMIGFGQSGVFEIYTSSPAATQWITGWTVNVYPPDGRHYRYSDDTPLPIPVPIPEPSSLAALLAGLAGFGAVMRRRRRN